MAATIQEVRTVDITLTDSQGYDTTYKINNPVNNLTIQQIRAVYAPVLTAGYLQSKAGYPFTQVTRAVLNEVTTRKEALE